MAIRTISAFNYGHKIDQNNQYINFSENGIDEITALVVVGSYSLFDFVAAVSVALNKAGSQEYTLTLDRTTSKITISAPSSFDLLIGSGSLINVSAYELMGFTGADVTGLDTYESDSRSGSQYVPQFLLQNYVDFIDEQRKAASSVSEAANGDVQVTSYGEVLLMSANITLATDLLPQVAVTENANGVGDLRDFMKYITGKNPIEFVADIDTPNTIVKCLLEKTPEGSDGTAFKLKELYSRNLTGYYETGNLQFRQINF